VASAPAGAGEGSGNSESEIRCGAFPAGNGHKFVVVGYNYAFHRGRYSQDLRFERKVKIILFIV